jgi:anti-anti-sigma factor
MMVAVSHARIAGCLRGAFVVEGIEEADMVGPDLPHKVPQTPVIAVDEAPGLVTVRLTGEFDLANVAALEDVLERTSGHNHVNIDLTGCEFLDSSILRVLLRATTDARVRDRWLSATVPPRGSVVHRMLEIAGGFDLMDLTVAPDE